MLPILDVLNYGGFITMDWRIKVAVQLFLSVIPWGWKVNYELQRHLGGLRNIAIYNEVQRRLELIEEIEKHVGSFQGKRILEVGTGWVPVIPVLLYLIGAEEIYTFDVLRHLRYDMLNLTIDRIPDSFDYVSERLGIPLKNLEQRYRAIAPKHREFEHILRSCGIAYVAPGDASATALPDDYLDIYLSRAVLEHIPRDVLANLTREAKRTLKSGGVMAHLIDLSDEYTSFDKSISELNFLKYSDRYWTILAKNKITYKNRMRECEFIEVFKNEGFEILSVKSKTASLDILHKVKVAECFSHIPKEELVKTRSLIVCRRG
jgi:SAM-dependent methyltransferase